METMSIADAMQGAMILVVTSSMPLLLIAMAVGLIIGILQTATSIQEQTLTFVPKILVIAVSLMVFGPWIFRMINDFTIRLFTDMYKYVG